MSFTCVARLLALTALVALLAGYAGGGAVRAQKAGPYARRGEEILQRVRQHFYDPKRVQDWAQKHAGYADALTSRDELVDKTRSILAELATSHTAYYPTGSAEHPELLAIFEHVLKRRPSRVSIGVDLARNEQGVFVRHVFAGGPGAKAGLVRGDRMVTLDGLPFETSRLSKASGHARTLTVERRRGAPLLTIRVTPARVHPKKEWLSAQRASSRIVEHEGVRVGYHAMFSCAGDEHEKVLADALNDTFAQVAALVIDLRDGWGGCSPQLLDLFNPYAPVLTTTDRSGKSTDWAPTFTKPLVLLVNAGSRSGKELVTYALKKHRAASVVGERTAGALMAGRALLLSDGSVLYVAAADIALDGQRLEGIGVRPDIEVRDALPYAEGKDPQLARAVEVAAAKVRASAGH